MMISKSKSDRNLLKLKLALAAGGLVATIIGTGLLGKEASTLTVDNSASIGITTSSDSAVNIDATIPEALDLDLEAVPTVAAPTLGNARVAIGRSSG